MFFEECHSTSIARSIYAAKNLASMFMVSVRCPCKIREVLPSARHQKLSNTTGVSSRLTLFGCRKYFLNSYIIKISMFMLKKNLPSTMCLLKNAEKNMKRSASSQRSSIPFPQNAPPLR